MTVAIGMFQPKDERNIGSLLRTAHLYDVDYTYQIGGVSYRFAATDTSRATKHIPHRVYDTFEDFLNAEYPAGLTHRRPLVAIEMDPASVPLGTYDHSDSALYLLGSENRGLPPEVLTVAQHIVQVETANPWSLNVATAGAIVLHHRYAQTLKEVA